MDPLTLGLALLALAFSVVSTWKAWRLSVENRMLKAKFHQLLPTVKEELERSKVETLDYVDRKTKEILMALELPSVPENVLENTRRTRTENEIVNEILRLREQGLSYGEIAKRIGKAKSYIWKVVNQHKAKATG